MAAAAAAMDVTPDPKVEKDRLQATWQPNKMPKSMCYFVDEKTKKVCKETDYHYVINRMPGTSYGERKLDSYGRKLVCKICKSGHRTFTTLQYFRDGRNSDDPKRTKWQNEFSAWTQKALDNLPPAPSVAKE
jgi:hypothetical protein